MNHRERCCFYCLISCFHQIFLVTIRRKKRRKYTMNMFLCILFLKTGSRRTSTRNPSCRIIRIAMIKNIDFIKFSRYFVHDYCDGFQLINSVFTTSTLYALGGCIESLAGMRYAWRVAGIYRAVVWNGGFKNKKTSSLRSFLCVSSYFFV